MVPKLSIIIVNFNTKKLIVDCVESIQKTNPKVACEIIVVDNGSTDGSVDVIKKLKGVQKIYINKNSGFSKANNKGIKKAKGKHILLLNSDTRVTLGAIDALFEFAEGTPDAGVVGSKLLNFDKSTQDSVFHFPTLTSAIKACWFGKANSYGQYHPNVKKPTEVDAVVGASFLITDKALRQVGKLDERYFMYFEDLDYCRRVWNAGLKVYYLPKSEVIHYHGKSGRYLAEDKDQWRRLIPSSKIYHGTLRYYLIYFVTWTGQKLQRAN